MWTHRVAIILTVSALTFGASITHATLYFSKDDTPQGLYVVDTATGVATLQGSGTSGVTSSTVGLAPSADATKLYGTSWVNLNLIQTDGEGFTQVAADVDLEGLAYCSSNNLLYGGINGQFFAVDPSNGQKTELAAPGFDAEGFACDPTTNIVYAVGVGTNLLAFGIAAATWSTIGDTGTDLSRAGLAFNGSLWATNSTEGGGTANLYKINPETAATELVGALGLDYGGGGLAWVGAVNVGPTAVGDTISSVPALPIWAMWVLAGIVGVFGVRRASKLT